MPAGEQVICVNDPISEMLEHSSWMLVRLLFNEEILNDAAQLVS